MVWPFFFNDEIEDSPKETAFEDETEKVVEEAFECDYERDCTPLYRAIENAVEEAEFEPIVQFLDTGYWPGSFFVDTISTVDQAKTWVTRFDPVDANKVKWSQLPLHLAIVCAAPPAIIGRLVRLYPQALRCTDDQHMLPLHLALRHGADDEIVAYLLMQFPDAVNAKGKNGRNAVECALRAKDKLRGKILEIFVSKTKGKKSSGVIKEQQLLKVELQSKTSELRGLQTDFDALGENFESIKTLKNSTEMELLSKIQDLEQTTAEREAEDADKIERLQSEKLLESLELHKKLEELESINTAVEASERQLRASETALRKELDAIHGRVSKSVSPDDWTSLKKEVEGMEPFRMERTRSETKTKIDSLKGELVTLQKSKTVDSNSTELQSELETLKKTVKKMEQSESGAKTAGELNKLRNEVDTLRAELKERGEASKTRIELVVLKKAMEMELKKTQGKTKEDLAALRKAIETANTSQLDNSTNAELAAMKTELESLKKELKNKELVAKAKNELEGLCANLDAEIKTADSKNKAEFTSMKKNAGQLNTDLEKNPDEVIAVIKKVEQMKDELKKKEAKTKIMDELTALTSTVEVELMKAEGKTQDELLEMKKAIKSLNEKDLSTEGVDELSQIKAELSEIKKELNELERATKTQQELDTLKKTLAAEMKSNVGKTEKYLTTMKKAVDEVNMEQKESKSLKKSLGEEIKLTNKNTEKGLLELKKALDAIDVKKLESKNKDAWDAIRIEMDSLKGDLKAKQVAKDITTELDSIKRTVAALNLDKIEKHNKSEFKSLREEMNAMRANLQVKDEGEAELKKEIEVLKKSDAKRKKGLKKFFSRQFSRKNKDEEISSAKLVSAVFKEDAGVKTIGPPSMGAKYSEGSQTSSEDDYSDRSASTGQVLAKLSVSFLDEEAPAVETVHTEETSSSSQKQKNKVVSPSKRAAKQLSPNSFRKVQSMDPRIASPRKFEHPVIRTLSKIAISESDDMELQNAITEEDCIETPTAVAAQ